MMCKIPSACLMCSVLLVGLLAAVVRAQTEQRTEDEATQARWEKIDQLVEPYLKHNILVGLSVGIAVDGKQQVRGYGRVAADSDRVPDGDTVFEIGSITKAVTGMLLGDAVAREEVRLDQPVQELLPEGVKMPQVSETPILLRHLATHTSGLPRLPNNLTPADPNNPYADYTEQQLYDFLSGYELTDAPDEQQAYSNLAMGLLGLVLARRSGVDYPQLLNERLTEPLGMERTAISLSDEMRENLAAPHHADGTPSSLWDIPTFAGAGAIRSTANDMLRLLVAQWERPAGTLGEGIDLAYEIHRPGKNKEEFSMGLGWHVARDGVTRWHNGQTGGYHSMALVDRDRRTAVVVLANTATGEVDRLAEDIFRMLVGVDVKPREFQQVVEVPEEVMQRYVGKYALSILFHLDITRENDRLYVQATGQPKFRLFTESETKWFLRVVDAQVTFKVDEAGECHEIVLHQNGLDQTAKRLDAESKDP